ncbi:hypothetical protein AVEN_125961-1 [Araneus ventricosus]|uniref:Uncharacterized protein n=1 Tax=Araneus ventricosus TaxID=182803 RepID=A0A4Y2RSZ7_ARAVE|nr:hypothetical protein AVEN_125961-1 [Araneus ventricosus]
MLFEDQVAHQGKGNGSEIFKMPWDNALQTSTSNRIQKIFKSTYSISSKSTSPKHSHHSSLKAFGPQLCMNQTSDLHMKSDLILRGSILVRSIGLGDVTFSVVNGREK